MSASTTGSTARDGQTRRATLLVVAAVGLAVLASVAALAAVGVVTTGAPGPSTLLAPGAAHVDVLPSPRPSGPMSLEEALSGRRSIRSFTGERLPIAEIGQLLWAAQGISGPDGRRTAPSAGATYPLELDIVTAEGVARYVPDGHRLQWRSGADLRSDLRRAALDQAVVGEAPLVIVISGAMERTAARYGDRARRYVLLEAGHAAQNVLLEAVSLHLGAVPVGAFDDTEVGRVLGLAGGEAPLYLIPVGRPR